MSGANSNQMRELAGLVDNLYLSSKNRRMMLEAPPTPQRLRMRKTSPRPTEPSRSSATRGGDTENEPHHRGSPGSVAQTSTPGPRVKSKPQAQPSSHEKKRFHTTLSKPTGGSSLTGKRWNLSCFTMGKPIGKGRFGNVYLAREKASMKVLALKIMLKKDLEAAGVYHQVKSEIDIHVNYGSGCPNIVRCYGYFYDEKRIFIVMEYARKGELYRTMKAQPGGRFSEDVAARYIYQLVRALQYLHGLNVIHRDIKPENLLLDKADGVWEVGRVREKYYKMKRGHDLHGGLVGEGIDELVVELVQASNACNLRLCDFGWSIEVADYDMRQTICGTQDYLAPEMLMERPYTTSVDLWAAGVVTYEFLVGRSPFRSESAGADTLSRIQRGCYDFPEEPSLSPESKDFVSKLLQVEPGDRMTLAEAMEHPWLRPQKALQAAQNTKSSDGARAASTA